MTDPWTTDPEAVTPVLRSAEFDTVLGSLEFDDKGDVTDIPTFGWYVWTGGEHVPVDPAELTE